MSATPQGTAPAADRRASDPRLEVGPSTLRIAQMGENGQLGIEIRREEDRAVVVLGGELDMASAPVLQRALADGQMAHVTAIVLDLRELAFIDSTGLRVVLAAFESSRDRGQDFAVTRGSPQVERLLSITGVAEHLRTIAAPDGALAGEQGQSAA